MARGALERAHSLLQRRRFPEAISILESGRNPAIYSESFDYFLTAGIACLYLGDTGSASSYFQRARHIRMTDKTLLLAQAVLYLRRGDTDNALRYYLDVLEEDPQNELALAATEFIRARGSVEEVFKAVDSHEIEKFYPPLGINPDWIKRIALSILAGVIIALLLLNLGNISKIFKGVSIFPEKERPDLSGLFLPVNELPESLQKKDLSNSTFKYIFSDDEIKKIYTKIKNLSTNYKENAARVEINRILNSNADDELKARLRIVLTKFSDATFDSLRDNKDNFDYTTVAKEPELYLGCTVSWSGRISNAVTEEDSYRCDLLVGYENMERVEGFVPVFFAQAPNPQIDGERPVHILGKIKVENGKILLDGRAIYQEIKK